MLESIRQRTSDQRGMSLIELMVTMVVVAVLMAIAIPTATTYMARQELKAAGREVVEVLRDARDAAMNEGVPRFVLFEPAANSYRVCAFDTAANNWPATSACRQVSLSNSVSFTDADVGFSAIPDQPSGTTGIPENAAYFDTRGRYPFGTAPSTFTLTLRSRNGQSLTLTLYTGTGQVTGL